jgi:hypothetical protein
METNNEIVQAPEHYNPNQLVTYKVINEGNVTYPTSKVVDLEWQLDSARRTERTLSALRLSVSSLEDMLPEWIEEDTSAAEIVSQICQLFDFSPTKEVEFEATIRVNGTVSVPLEEIANFDVNDIDLNIEVNSFSHDIQADGEVEYISAL